MNIRTGYDPDRLILYDYLAARGGAERLLLDLIEGYPSDVCVGYVRSNLFTPAECPDHLIDLALDRPNPMWRAIALVRGFRNQQARVSRYRTRVFTGPFSLLAQPGQATAGQSVYYCHTPPRFLYDLRELFESRLPAWQRPLLAAFRSYYQSHYESAVRSMDTVLANSTTVQQRLRHFLGIDARVVYPPVNMDRFRWCEDAGYFLSMARLEPEKRVDRIVAAFLKMPRSRLLIASGGPCEQALRQQAGNAANIEFVGWQSEQAMTDLVGQCRATIYVARDEDFGMSPVESMAAGKPVIGVAEGGLTETVVDGETGWLLPPDFEPDQLMEAVRRMTKHQVASMRDACEHRAQRFDQIHFWNAWAPYLEAAND